MLRIFEAVDLWHIEPQPTQALSDADRVRILHDAVPRGPCWTYESGGGVLAVGGFCLMHAGWATAWTILGQKIGAAMVGLTRAVSAQLRVQQQAMPGGRIDMHIDPAHINSIRWAGTLGFERDAWLGRALPDGRDMAVWLYQGGSGWTP